MSSVGGEAQRRSSEQSRVRNEIHGGVHGGTVIQGRDITFHTFHLPRPNPESLRGLPRLSPVFTGRDADVEALLESLDPVSAVRRGSPTVVISGMPGSGKTELALHTARRALEQQRWFDGVLYADLFGYDPQRRVDPHRVLGGWLLNLGVDAQDIPVDIQGKQHMYRSELSSRAERGQPLLVVVDNASSRDQVEPLLPGDGRSGVLVTSRHVLDVEAKVHRLAELNDEGAVEVIRRSLWEHGRETDTRVADHPVDALRLARLCGRLPLALRIVAGLLADVPTLTLAQMTDELRKKMLDGLEREGRDVRAAFDLSYRNLTGRQAELFRLVALAPGTDVSTESASVLVEAEETETRRLLMALARASLVESVGADRWKLHDLVRLYAGEQTGESDRAGAGVSALRKLLTHLMLTADAADDRIRALPGEKAPSRFTDEKDAQTWLSGEQDTLIAAFWAAHEMQMEDCVINLPLILQVFLRSRMRLADLLEMAEAGCHVAEGSGRPGDAAKLWGTVGETLSLLRRFERASEALDRSFALAVAAGDRHSAAGALNGNGVALRHLKRFDEALERHTEAMRMFDLLGDQVGVAKASNNKGSALMEAGRLREAVASQEVAMQIYAQLGDGRGFARTCLNMGQSYFRLGEHGLAATTLQWACDYSREGGDSKVLAMAASSLAVSLYRTGRPDEGRSAFEEALRLFEELGDLYNEARTWRNFGVALRENGRGKEADRAFRVAVSAFAGLGDSCGEGDCWTGICGILLEEGKLEGALAAARRSVQCHEGLVQNECAAVSWNNLAHILAEADRIEEAVEAMSVSRDMSIAQRNPGKAAQISRTMGFKLVEMDEFDAAAEAFGMAARLFTEVGAEESARQAGELRAECAALFDETDW